MIVKWGLGSALESGMGMLVVIKMVLDWVLGGGLGMNVFLNFNWEWGCWGNFNYADSLGYS